MAALVVGTFLTLDGVMQGPGGPDEDRSGGFAHGGWSVGYWNEAMGRIITEWTAKADALLLGRTTYEIFATHWPHVPDGLLQTLIGQDLVDEYRLWTFPVLLGSGKRLFDAGTIPAGLELIDSTISSTGVVIDRDRRAGDVRHGSFAVDERGRVEALWTEGERG